MCLSLVLALVVIEALAGPANLGYSRGSFVVPLSRQQHTFILSQESGLPGVFNLHFVENELRRLPAKYSRAAELLRGVDPRKYLSPSKKKTVVAVDTELEKPTAEPSNAPAPIRPILAASGTAQVPLTDFFDRNLDILYYADIKIGTPPQIFTVDIDTGSSDLFIPSNCPDCRDHKQFNSQPSTTFVDKGNKPFTLSYGSGEAEGVLAQDVVSMQGLSYPNQTFIAVSKESDDFKDEPNDGIIGMAFSSIAVSKQPTFFENLMRTNAVAKPMFSIYLTRSRSTGSELCLGCYNSEKATGPLTYVPVVSKTYWTLPMDGLAANNTVVLGNNVLAAVDSGTTLIYVPAELAANFYALIPGSRQAPDVGPNLYAYPCNVQFNVSIVFGKKNYLIDMADFNLGRASSTSTECIGGIIPLGNDFPSNLAIVGDEFLKSWYTVFDYSDDAQVGFAPSINNRP